MSYPWRGLRVLAALLMAGCATAGSDPDASQGDPADAAENTIDAPGFPDAAVPRPDSSVLPDPPDAMPGTPDAAGCTIQTINILGNGNFDAGATTWVESGAGYPIILSPSDAVYPLPVTPQSGTFAAWLGGLDSSTRSIHQEVAIPASTTAASLTGYYWIATEETGTTVYDSAVAQIQSQGGGTLLQSLQSWNNTAPTSAWTAFSSNLGNYAGQTIRVRVASTQDSSLNTNFFFDTLVLNVTVCQ